MLAFADSSPGKDQEYFSDGIAEEILNALARVKGLKVAGRTSSFHFKGRNEDLHAIGVALGVDNVLEGSVRKQGNKVRITAQLIKARDGFHLWSKTYDGDLTDVFELQERIARAITAQLQVLSGPPAAPGPGRHPEPRGLRALSPGDRHLQPAGRVALRRRRLPARAGPGPRPRPTPWPPRAPRCPPRHHPELLHPRREEAAVAASEKHARQAIQLDSGLAEPHAVLGLLLGEQRRWEEAGVAFRRAFVVDPDDITANFWSATNLVVEGYARQGAEVLDRVLVLDPILPNALMWRGTQFFNNGDLDGAERLLRRANDLGLFYVGLGLSAVSDARGRKEEAVQQITPALRVFLGDFAPDSAEVLARGIFGDADARAKALALVFGVLWGPYGRAARALPAFPEFARKVGLAAYWDRHGPPDGCRRVGPIDYRCE